MPVVWEIQRIRNLPMLTRGAAALALLKTYAPEYLQEAAIAARVFFWEDIVAKARQIEAGPPADEIPLEAAEALRGETLTVEELSALTRQEVILIIRAMYRKHVLNSMDVSNGILGSVWDSFVRRVHRAFDPDNLCYNRKTEFFWYLRDLRSIRMGLLLNGLFNTAEALWDYDGPARGSPVWIEILEETHEASKEALAAAEARAPEIAKQSDAEIASSIFRGLLGDIECEAVALSAIEPLRLLLIYQIVTGLQGDDDDDEDYYERCERRYGRCD